MTNKKLIVFLSVIFSLLCINTIFAQDAEKKELVLTVEDAVNYAKENSRNLKSAAIDLQIKKRNKDFSWNVLIPSVQASGTIGRKNDVSNPMDDLMSSINPMYKPKEIVESDHWSFVGNINTSLNLSAALVEGIKASHKNYEAGLISWEQTCKETELNIQKMFYALLLQQESLEVQKTTLANSKERFDQAKINYRNGLIPEISLLQTEVSYENLKPKIVKQEQAYEQQLDTFAFLIGIPTGTPIKLQGEIKPEFVELNPDELFQMYMNNSLEMKSFNTNLDLMNIQLAAQNLQIYTPVLSLSYGWQPMIKDFGGDWGNGDNWMNNGTFSTTLAWNITNMLPTSSASVNARNLKNNIEQMNLNLINMEENAKMKINNLVNTLNQSKAAIEASYRNIQLAQKSYDMTSASYKNGTTELLDVKEAETQLNQAKLGMANEKYNYLSNLLDLEYAINTKLTH